MHEQNADKQVEKNRMDGIGWGYILISGFDTDFDSDPELDLDDKEGGGAMIDLLRTRRSIRAYTDRAIEPEKIEILKEALLRSPSSREIRPWRFYFVESPGLLAALSRCKPHGADFLKNARLGIVVCGEPDRSDVWVEDCAIAALVAHLTAHSLGLGSCWSQVRNRNHDEATTAEAYVRSTLGLPDNLTVEAIVAVGYPAEEKPGIAAESLPVEKITVV